MRVLVIDQSYFPCSFVSRQKALKMVFLGKAMFLLEQEVLQLFRSVVKYLPHEISYSHRRIHQRDDNVCQYCGCSCHGRNKTIDHILPVSRGGGTSYLNCVTACLECNQKKGSKTPAEAGMTLLRKPSNVLYKDVLFFVGADLMKKFESFLQGEF